jgi:hypothetical protein
MNKGEGEIERLVSEIMVLKQREAERGDRRAPIAPEAPAAESAIATAEARRGVRIHEQYRSLLLHHDGWKRFSGGVSLYSATELAGEVETSIYFPGGWKMDTVVKDCGLSKELQRALVIGESENDARLVFLLPSGEIVDWLYEEDGRSRDFIAFLERERASLAKWEGTAAEARAKVRDEWLPATRARREAALLTELRSTLAAPRRELPALVVPPASEPVLSPVTPGELEARGQYDMVAASVHLSLMLYLGAQPSPDEVKAVYLAFRRLFPVAGALEHEPGHKFALSRTQADPDELGFLESLEPDDFGYFGLRAEIASGSDDAHKYTLNVRGLPPEDGDSEDEEQTRARASFCEVMVPPDENPEALFALACELMDALPVRSGYAGFGAYGKPERAANDAIFDWCQRFFALEVGHGDGWFDVMVNHVRGASWLTLFGETMTQALDEAGRLEHKAPITMHRCQRGVIVRAGDAPTLGDVARGEFPFAIAEVERAIQPLKPVTYREHQEFTLAGLHFSGVANQLSPFASHHATEGFLLRLVTPSAFLETPRRKAEAILEQLTSLYGGGELAKWRANREEGWRAFQTLLNLIYEQTRPNLTKDESIAALQFLLQFDSAPLGFTVNRLLCAFLQRGDIDRALAMMDFALAFSEENPYILHNAACIFSRAGDYAAALECVLGAKRVGYKNMESLLKEEDLDILRALPGFPKPKKSRRAPAAPA